MAISLVWLVRIIVSAQPVWTLLTHQRVGCHQLPFHLLISCWLDTQAVEATVTVTNAGTMAGKEPVLMFLSDRFRITLPEVKMLKGFHKTDELEPGQSEKVVFTITCDQLAFVGVELTWVVSAPASAPGFEC